MTRAMFETTLDVQACMDFLESREQASYAEINGYTGRAVDGKDRYILSSARRQLERKGVFFVTVRGVGVERASNGQLAQLSTTQPISRIRQVTHRAQRRERHVNIQALSAEDRLAFTIGRAVIAAIDQTTLKSFRTHIAKQIEEQDGDLVGIQQLITLPRFRAEKP